MRDLLIFGGSSHPTLSDQISKRLGLRLGNSRSNQFSNKELNVEIVESVRDVDVYIIQTGSGKVNDNLMEMLIMISACKIASAREPESPFKKNGQLTSRIPKEEHHKFACLMPGNGAASPVSPMMETFVKFTEAQQPTFLLDEEIQASHCDGKPPLQPLTPHPGLSGSQGSTNAFEGLKITQDMSKTTPVKSPVLTFDPTLEFRKKSSISTSQPNLEIFQLQPKKPRAPLTRTIPLSHTGSKVGYKTWNAKPGTLIAEMLEAAGADHIITLDLHDPQFQGYFNIPVDNLKSLPLILKYIKEKIPDYQRAGGAKRATTIADHLSVDFALIHKERKNLSSESHSTTGSDMIIVGDVKDRECILYDDIADTSYTITKAARVLKSNGATKIYAIVTHAILSGDAIKTINESAIDEFIVSNTVPQDAHLAACPKLKQFDVSPLFAEAIRRIHNGESVSYLFNVVPI